MSILIKGMEMPKHAGVNEDKDTVYRCIVIAHPDNSAELVIDTEFASPYDNGHNVKRCPLVEVPTPHGRLIDENELLRHKYGFSQTARVIIKNTDAVIEAEVNE